MASMTSSPDTEAHGRGVTQSKGRIMMRPELHSADRCRVRGDGTSDIEGSSLKEPPVAHTQFNWISVRANLLDDGVVDTLGSVGATSGVRTSVSINDSESSRNPFAQLYEKLVNKCA
jgi:hypothetical protein